MSSGLAQISGNLVRRRLELLLNLLGRDERVADRLGQQRDAVRNSAVERCGLVDEGSRATTRSACCAAEHLHGLEHVVGGALRSRLEGEPVDDVAGAGEVRVLVARAGVEVDADAREVAGQVLRGYADAIWEGGEGVELDGVLVGVRCSVYLWKC